MHEKDKVRMYYFQLNYICQGVLHSPVPIVQVPVCVPVCTLVEA